MLLIPANHDNWRLLTPQNIRVRQLWGWGYSIQKFVSADEPQPRQSDRLLIASDYGGDHPRSTHHIYCYLIVRHGGPDWFSTVRSVRRTLLPDGRTMSYKRLGDPQRQKALVPFLTAAADIDGHLVTIAVDKRKKWLSTSAGAADSLRTALGLKASWNPRSLEAMMRKVHFTAILLSIWSRPYTNVTWITDEDEFVANDNRHDDALQAAARMSSFYLSHPMGVFRLNRTGQDPESKDYEDLCAIPDLAAGMLSEISTRLAKEAVWEEKLRCSLEVNWPIKTDLIADWFWDEDMRLRKTLITIDVEGAHFGVRKIRMQGDDEETGHIENQGQPSTNQAD